MKKFLIAVIFIFFISGCGRKTPEIEFIKKVNADDKRFKGEWVYKSQIAGQFTYSVRTRIRIGVDGKRFYIFAKWTEANLPEERRDEKWVYDGKILWQIIPSEKRVNYIKVREFKRGPFWKIPERISPFPPPKKIMREEKIAGRDCIIFQVKGKYGKGDVKITYWIDKEKNLLLKKEHILERDGAVVVRECYECEYIEFAPVFEEGTFKVDIPHDWVKVKKIYLDCELLKTKF